MANLKLVAVAVAIFLVMADKAFADEDQWSCSASADGPNQSGVEVVVQLTTSGSIVHRYVRWDPPIIDEAGSVDSLFDAPAISLFYDAARSEMIGEVTSILLSASALGAPEDALLGKSISLAVDAFGPLLAELPSQGVGPDYFIGRRRLVQRSTFVEGPIDGVAQGTNARVSLTSGRGKILAEARYDLSARAERDQLFAEAWSRAERLALHPERCVKADGVLPPEYGPPLVYPDDP